MTQAHWLVKLLFPPSWCGLASRSPCHSPHRIRSHPFGKPSLVLQLQAVLPPQCIKQPHIECSVFWALSLGAEGHRTRPRPLLHCGCLSIHAVHLSLPRLEPPLPHVALGGVCLPRADLVVPVSFLSLLPLFCVFSAPPPGAKKERRRREKFIITRLDRSDFIHPFCLLHGVCLNIRCDTR